jgi:hypothetical protein
VVNKSWESTSLHAALKAHWMRKVSDVFILILVVTAILFLIISFEACTAGKVVNVVLMCYET